MLGSARSVLWGKKAIALPSSAMALFGFSEGSGTTSADLSGNSRTATISNATWTASGHNGPALTNSTTSVGAKSVFTAPTAAISIMAWVKPLDVTAGTTHIAYGFVDNGGNTCCAIFTQRADFGTANVLQGSIRIGGVLQSLTGPSALTVNVWTHLALTYDGATAILYKDGVQVTSVSVTGIIGQGDALCIAGPMIDGAYSSNVVVDDVRVYNTGLTASQIVTGMNTPVA